MIKEVQVSKIGEEISRNIVDRPNLKTYRTGKERMIRTNKKYTEKGLTTTAKTSIKGNKEDDYLVCGQYEDREINDKVNNVALFKHKNGKFYFAMYNTDGSVRLRSEGFPNAKQRDQELASVLKLRDNKDRYTREERGQFFMDVLHDETGREVGRSCLQKTKTTAETKVAPQTKIEVNPTPTAATMKKPIVKANDVYKDAKYGLKSDNLQVVEGIGPKINQLLNDAGIVTWRQLSQTNTERLKQILTDAGPRFKMHNPQSWPEQALFAADEKWQGLIDLQKVLDGGKEGSNTVSDSKLEKMLIKKGKIKN